MGVKTQSVDLFSTQEALCSILQEQHHRNQVWWNMPVPSLRVQSSQPPFSAELSSLPMLGELKGCSSPRPRTGPYSQHAL